MPSPSGTTTDCSVVAARAAASRNARSATAFSVRAGRRCRRRRARCPPSTRRRRRRMRSACSKVASRSRSCRRPRTSRRPSPSAQLRAARRHWRRRRAPRPCPFWSELRDPVPARTRRARSSISCVSTLPSDAEAARHRDRRVAAERADLDDGLRRTSRAAAAAGTPPAPARCGSRASPPVAAAAMRRSRRKSSSGIAFVAQVGKQAVHRPGCSSWTCAAGYLIPT